jgi:two-component system chemotaxis response regulator CheB
MLSRFTRKGSPTTLDALSLGARDYVPIPERLGSEENLYEELRQQLLAKIEQYRLSAPASSSAERVKDTPAPGPTRLSADLFPRSCAGPIELVAIGSSTGGPTALSTVLAALPADFPVPIVIVQHMPALFTPLLAKRLAAQCSIEVVEGAPGDVLRPGKAWLAPGDNHLVLARQGVTVQIRTHREAPENSCRPSVDVLLRSTVEVYGSSVLAVVLTGMGQDGLRGCEMVREKGGQILVQDESSSVVWGMPGYVARAGLADQILPLDQIGPELLRRVRSTRTMSRSGLRQA